MNYLRNIGQPQAPTSHPPVQPPTSQRSPEQAMMASPGRVPRPPQQLLGNVNQPPSSSVSFHPSGQSEVPELPNYPGQRPRAGVYFDLPSMPSPTPSEPPATQKIQALYSELRGLRQTIKEEIKRLRDLQTTILQQDQGLNQEKENRAFYEGQIKRLKKEKEDLSSLQVLAPHSNALEILKEEQEQNKRRIDEQIRRWEDLLSTSRNSTLTWDVNLTSERAELRALRGALVVHDETRKQLINALNEIEETRGAQSNEEVLDVLITRIESSLPQLTYKEENSQVMPSNAIQSQGPPAKRMSKPTRQNTSEA
ncbi:hypothetical protein FRB91_007968 [Serendipita sp. 411]|nr:hypothetical protein FRC19_001676 [Serendipita sp. 401]KAG8851413.1 hypothetical protein FRB91_007968 [Serendipita sp. 411]KAG9031573.1 hypothetical protein FS842_004240 [Serendipita sp. 407]